MGDPSGLRSLVPLWRLSSSILHFTLPLPYHRQEVQLGRPLRWESEVNSTSQAASYRYHQSRRPSPSTTSSRALLSFFRSRRSFYRCSIRRYRSSYLESGTSSATVSARSSRPADVHSSLPFSRSPHVSLRYAPVSSGLPLRAYPTSSAYAPSTCPAPPAFTSSPRPADVCPRLR